MSAPTFATYRWSDQKVVDLDDYRARKLADAIYALEPEEVPAVWPEQWPEDGD